MAHSHVQLNLVDSRRATLEALEARLAEVGHLNSISANWCLPGDMHRDETEVRTEFDRQEKRQSVAEIQSDAAERQERLCS